MLQNKLFTLLALLASLSLGANEVSIQKEYIIQNEKPAVEATEIQNTFQLNTTWKLLIAEALTHYADTFEYLYPEGLNFVLKAAMADLGDDGIPEILVSVVYDYMSPSLEYITSNDIFSIFYLNIENQSVERFEMPLVYALVTGLAYPHGLYTLYPPGITYSVLFQDGSLYGGDYVFSGTTLHWENYRLLEHPDVAKQINQYQTEEENAVYHLYYNAENRWENIAIPLHGHEDFELLFHTYLKTLDASSPQ